MEHLNRCLAVTDKGKIAWHKQTIGLAEGFSWSQFVVSCLVWRWPQKRGVGNV
jgi:hypothetical protein